MSEIVLHSTPALSTIAVEIRREVEAAEASYQDALGHALRVGELLIEAKGEVQHGQWLPWLEANFPGSIRSAQCYMRLARNRDEYATVAHLGIKGALKELAAGDADRASGSESHGDSDEQIDQEARRLVAERNAGRDVAARKGHHHPGDPRGRPGHRAFPVANIE